MQTAIAGRGRRSGGRRDARAAAGAIQSPQRDTGVKLTSQFFLQDAGTDEEDTDAAEMKGL